MSKNKVSLATIMLTVLISFTSCGVMRTEKGTEGARAQATQVSIEYIRLCFLANIRVINSYVLLSEYVTKKGITLEDYENQISRFTNRWSMDSHPFVQLKVIESSVIENQAQVKLQKNGADSDYPVITIKLEWTGNSWVVIDDNIFGRNGIFAHYK